MCFLSKLFVDHRSRYGAPRMLTSSIGAEVERWQGVALIPLPLQRDDCFA
jgi:hypothetical protein